MTEWELDPFRFYFSGRAWKTVPRTLRESIQVVRAAGQTVGDGVVPCCFAFASEILGVDAAGLPEWLMRPATRYAVLLDDVPLSEIPRIPTVLNLRKPDQRMHLTGDVGVVRRAVVSLLRDHPGEAVLDAWVFADRLTLLLADLGKRTVDPRRIPSLRKMGSGDLPRFEIDPDGSYLHWPGPDVHLGVSQILQAVDPEYRARVEIERNALDYTGWALREWRQERQIRQTDIEGVSERHVGRVERGVSRLTLAVAERFAEAFGITTREFLDELARRTRETREEVESSDESKEPEEPEVVVLPAA